MLILTRKIDERLVIGEDIYLTMLGIKGNQVRIGIDAPKDVTVHREEIFLKLKAQQNMMYACGSQLNRGLAQVFRAYQNSTSARQFSH